MDIQDIRHLHKLLDADILQLIRNFETATGTAVTGVDLLRDNRLGDSVSTTVHVKTCVMIQY